MILGHRSGILQENTPLRYQKKMRLRLKTSNSCCVTEKLNTRLASDLMKVKEMMEGKHHL